MFTCLCHAAAVQNPLTLALPLCIGGGRTTLPPNAPWFAAALQHSMTMAAQHRSLMQSGAARGFDPLAAWYAVHSGQTAESSAVYSNHLTGVWLCVCTAEPSMLEFGLHVGHWLTALTPAAHLHVLLCNLTRWRSHARPSLRPPRGPEGCVLTGYSLSAGRVQPHSQ